MNGLVVKMLVDQLVNKNVILNRYPASAVVLFQVEMANECNDSSM